MTNDERLKKLRELRLSGGSSGSVSSGSNPATDRLAKLREQRLKQIEASKPQEIQQEIKQPHETIKPEEVSMWNKLKSFFAPKVQETSDLIKWGVQHPKEVLNEIPSPLTKAIAQKSLTPFAEAIGIREITPEEKSKIELAKSENISRTEALKRIRESRGEEGALAGLNALPMGGMGANIAESIAKAGTIKATKNIIKELGQKYSDDLADTILQAKTVEEAKNVLEKIIPKKNIAPIENQSLNPSNFKSAEDYVKAQGTPVYHGTDKEFNAFEKSFRGSNTGKTPANMGGYSFTDNADVAKTFGKNIKESYLNIEKPFVIDAKGKSYSEMKHIINDAVDTAKKKGYDGIEIRNYHDAGLHAKDTIQSNHFIALDESQIKTKSQLIEEWNKANVQKVKTGSLDESYPTSMKEANRLSTESEEVLSKEKSQQPNQKQTEKNSTNSKNDLQNDPIKQVELSQQSGEKQLSQKLNQSYFDNTTEIDKKSIADADRVLTSPIDKNHKNKEVFKRVVSAYKRNWTKIRETVQDDWIRVKNLQRDKNINIDKNALNPYEAETLYHGRVSARISEADEIVKKIDNDILDTSKTVKVSDNDLKADVYDYLIAKHAPERNASLGEKAAGITTEEAGKIMSDIKAKPHFAEVERIASDVKKLNDEVLDILHDSQVIDDDLYKTLREKYKEHIPLNRIMDESEDIGGALTSRGLSVKGSGIKRAKGSEREVDDILKNVVSNYKQAIVRAEKNRVNLATLKFSRDNKQLGIFEEIKPKAIGKTFDDKMILQEVRDPLVLTIRENGKPVYLRIKDEGLARVFQGLGKDKMPEVLKFISAFTKFYAGMATRFNPEFAFSNKIRDLQEMAVYMASEKGIGFSGAIKTTVRDSVSMKNVLEGILKKDTAGAKLYEQMIKDGGTTGGMSLSTKKQLVLDLENIQKLNRSKTRQAAKYFIEKIDQWNTIFEDSTRLSVYKTALDKGMTRDQAAILAKNSTLNFNKKGTGGAIINSLYMFSNASIQGSAKLFKAMKNPKVAGAVVGSVGIATWTVNKWNDSIDESWREKVDKWDRNSNLVVVMPTNGGTKYFTIPVSWGIKPIKVAADYAYDATVGKMKGGIKEASAGIIAAGLEAYNPASGTDIPSAVTPTILDTPSEIWRNTKWSGSKIHPDERKGVKESENYYKDKEGNATDKSLVFKTSKKVSEVLSKNGIEVSPTSIKYAYEQYIGGTGRTVNGLSETIKSAIEGKLSQASDRPFLRRFYKEKTDEEIDTTEKYQKKDDFFSKVKSMDEGEEKTKFIQEYIRSFPEEQRSVKLYGLMQEGVNTKGVSSSENSIRAKELAKQWDSLSSTEKLSKLKEEIKRDVKFKTSFKEALSERNMTQQEIDLKNGSVDERAITIKEKLKELKGTERTQYIVKLKKQGILTDSVIKKIKQL